VTDDWTNVVVSPPMRTAVRVVCRECQRYRRSTGEIARIELAGFDVWCTDMPLTTRSAIGHVLEYGTDQRPPQPPVSPRKFDWSQFDPWTPLPDVVTFHCRCGDSDVPTNRLVGELRRFLDRGRTRVIEVR
jgi:hypothetical protein